MGAKARTKISGQPAKNYIDILAADTGAGRNELPGAHGKPVAVEINR